MCIYIYICIYNKEASPPPPPPNSIGNFSRPLYYLGPELLGRHR